MAACCVYFSTPRRLVRELLIRIQKPDSSADNLFGAIHAQPFVLLLRWQRYVTVVVNREPLA